MNIRKLIFFFAALTCAVSGFLYSKASTFPFTPTDNTPVGAVKQGIEQTKDTTASKPKFPIKDYNQNTYQDVDKKYPLDAPNPNNMKSVVEYDPASGGYVFRTYIGENEIATPFTMSNDEYWNYSAKKEMQGYWKEKNAKAEANNEDKFKLSDMKFSLGPADKIFGPGGVQIKTQGSAEITLGIKHNRIDNPTLTQNARSSTIFDFDEKIQLNVNGKVGDKISLGMNYNTESSFDFDQKAIKLAYKGKEDDAIQSIEAGNVSMNLNSSLISGSTALFGIKTDLKFGKLRVTALASQQQSETKTVSSKGGSQTTSYEINADDYDANRHYFLSQYFRDNYEKVMKRLPNIASGITINRVEVWITNKRGQYDDARNIIAFMDLGEPSKIGNPHWAPTQSPTVPDNKTNTLYSEILGISGIRDIDQVNSVLSTAYGALGINGGEDYDKVESARKLSSSEYTLNSTLGIVSLKTALNPDEVLAVAYEYTANGQTYQVGEFSTDGIEAPKNLIVKLLKSTSEAPGLKSWDLMMKNVYSLGATQVQQDNFTLDVVYQNDSVGTQLRYLPEGKLKSKLLLRVMDLDRLDSKKAENPDGKFDFIDGYTIQASSGKIFFPVLEPFGSNLRKAIDDNTIADKYVFQELYDSTLVAAQELSEKNKFKLVGKYKATSGSEIQLNAMNIPRGSVTVTAGGSTLIENTDYTVDYTMGTVTILNQSLVESGTNIDVKLENQSAYNTQRKSLVGTHLEYEFSKNFTLGGTIMHLSETPLTTKVNSGDEPISNTIWGLNTSWRTESQWLTNMIDKLPFVNATQPSTIALNAEFAQLIPGHSSTISSAGLSYIDDFESTQTSIDIHYPIYWFLASTPSYFDESKLSNNTDYGKNRALLAWYHVDPILNGDSRTTPSNLRNNPDLQSDHLTRNVLEQEVFPNKETSTTESSRITVMNLSYYPTERGPYNVDVAGMNSDGTLANPKQRWGGIMRKLDQTDFEAANIEYIEFWVMDPFIKDTNHTNKGGELFFNLGDVSEDILKDGKKFFEHGMPTDGDETKTETTVWGRVPKTQSTVTAFDNAAGTRKYQDVGLDGLMNSQESQFPTYKNYVENLRQKLSPATVETMKKDSLSPLNDPSGDNYHYYRGSDYDSENADILTRYKHYNGTEGNSPETNNNSDYSSAATTLPNVEDINGDNTLNEYERYFQYRVSIKRDSMAVGENFITDSITSNVKLKNGKTEAVTWYQFKIPIRDYTDKVGNIKNFKSIRFIRMFLTGFEQDMTLRFATLDLVRGEWRTYTKTLYDKIGTPTTDAQLNVQTVNIEENSNKTPVNYVLPPGVSRETDPSQPQLLQENEQAMVLKVNNLAPGDARSVYKTTSFDMRNYKKLQMFVHAEKLIDDLTGLNDGELSCFIRLGSDLNNNYYEYEIPLTLTPEGTYSNKNDADRLKVWNPNNMFDFAFSKLVNAKISRNKAKQTAGSSVTNTTRYETYDTDNENNRIYVKGNPAISDVENIMIGIRNKTNGEVLSGEVWVNELRMSGFNEEGGWAAMGNMAVGLSDIGTVNVSGRMETSGYGSIESNVQTRRNTDLYQVNFSTSLDLGRFLPEKAKLQIPTYYSYSNETVSPKYNPLDEDVTLNEALADLKSQSAKDSLKNIAQTVSTTKSFNITNARVNIKSKKPQFYDPANVSVTYASTQVSEHTPEIEQNLEKNQRLALNYNYSFNPKPVEPFKNVKALGSPVLKIIKDFNFNYLPSSLSYYSNLNRQYSQVRLRNLTADETSSSTSDDDLSFSKNFTWNREFELKYDLSKNIKMSFHTATNANIEEPYYTPEVNKDYYDEWRDKVWSSIKKMGSPYAYDQVFNLTWKIPVDKLPYLDWVSVNASYNGNYNWDRTVKSLSSDFWAGNIATSQRVITLDGQLNFENFYNKWKYLKEVNRKFSAQQQAQNSPDRSRGQQPSRQLSTQAKTFSNTYKLERNKATTINHKLISDKVKVSVFDKKGNPVKFTYKPKGKNDIEIFPKVSADSAKVVVISENTPVKNLANNNNSVTPVDFVARLLMMVRRATFSYRESNSMVLNGFAGETGLLGQGKTEDGSKAPGYAFTFGLFDDNFIEKAKSRNWLVMNDSITPATTAFTSDFKASLSLEPISGLKIELTGVRNYATSNSISYMYDDMPTTYTGSFNISTIAVSTAFKKTGGAASNYNSETFNKFLENRQVVADRLNARYAGTRYPNAGFLEGTALANSGYNSSLGAFSNNSSDVLIPAFFAAYTGRSASSVKTNPFLSLLDVLPNWRLSYDGLTRIDWLAERFKSVSLTHAYTCKYSIGSYTSYSTWVAMDDEGRYGYVRDVSNDNPIPSSVYNISSVSLSEQFNPLIGLNLTMKNSMTTTLEYSKQRNMVLNVSSTQLIESTADEYKIGFGYVLKDFDVILRLKNDKQSKIKNDLKLTANLSYKDVKGLLRKIDENITQATNGNKMFTLKITADYVFSSKLNIQLYYDHQSTTPLVSSSYPVSSTNFGTTFKFMLTR